MRSNIPTQRRAPAQAGFTLLELIIVIAVIGILAAIALPNFIQTPTRAKEAVLKTNLRTIREVLDQHYGDKGFYPPTLETLVEEGYLRNVPYDPMTDKSEWALVYDQSEDELDPLESDFEDGETAGPGIIDVHSMSQDSSLDGTPYAEW